MSASEYVNEYSDTHMQFLYINIYANEFFTLTKNKFAFLTPLANKKKCVSLKNHKACRLQAEVIESSNSSDNLN